jgi:hypothetical protein
MLPTAFDAGLINNAKSGLKFYREIPCFFKGFSRGNGFEPPHRRVRRALPEGLLKNAQSLLGPESLDLHGAAPKVPRPSGEAEGAGFADYVIPETDALHAAVYDPSRSFFLHQANHTNRELERPVPAWIMQAHANPKGLRVLCLLIRRMLAPSYFGIEYSSCLDALFRLWPKGRSAAAEGDP